MNRFIIVLLKFQIKLWIHIIRREFMMNKRYFFISVLLITILLPDFTIGQGNPDFNGRWTILKEKSSEIGLYEALSIDIQQQGSDLTIIHKWGTSRGFSDTLNLKTDGTLAIVPIKDRVFPTNVFMGLSLPVGTKRQIKASWENNGAVLDRKSVV